MRLTLCPGCSRHVRDDTDTCPFCDVAIPRPGPTPAAVPRGLARAARYAYPAAALVACAASERSRTVEAPTETATPPGGGAQDASPAATASGQGRAAGMACHAEADCASGLTCCRTGMTGKCGGAVMQGVQYPPCVVTSTCVAPPCQPLPMPPYGCVFPDACGRVLV